MHNLSAEKPTLIKGLAAIIGEIVVGVNGPFLFERFGLDVPVAIASGVAVGAVAGVSIASIVLALRHREPVRAKAPGVPADAHPHRA